MNDSIETARSEVICEEFRAVCGDGCRPRCVGSDFRFTEGPVWLPGPGAPGLLFSDIPAAVIYRWAEGEGCSVWRADSRHANGNVLDLDGRLLTCEHGSRSLRRTEPDGSITTLADAYDGKKLNSPNDVVVASDGAIWFTDPPYGIKPDQQEQPGQFVFRLEGATGKLTVAADDFSRPNGLCFSPDEKRLYIADSDSARHHVRVFRVRPGGVLEGGEVFVTIRPGVPDGMRTDTQGRLYSTAADGVHVFAPDGRLLGKLLTPEPAANCCFGGEGFRTLFVTARTRVWAFPLAAAGARPTRAAHAR